MRLKLLQLYLLIWKCWKTESRNKLRITLQIIWPLFMFVILVVVRITKNLRFPQTECHFDAKPLPSAGLLPFIQGFICTFNNTCYGEKTLSENSSYPFRQVPVVGLLRETADVLRLANRTGLFETLPHDLRVIQDFSVILLNNSAVTHMNFSDLYNPSDIPDIKSELIRRGLPPDAVEILMTSHINGPEMARVLTSRGQGDDSAALDSFFDFAYGRTELTGDEVCKTDIVTVFLRPPDGDSESSLKYLQSSLCDLSNNQLRQIGDLLRRRVSMKNFAPKFRSYISFETGFELMTEASQLREFFRESNKVFADGSTVRFLNDLSNTLNLTDTNISSSNPLARIAPFWYPLCNRPFPINEMADAFKSYTGSIVDTSDAAKLDTSGGGDDKKNQSQICREMKRNQTYDNSTSCECNAFLLPLQKVNFLWKMIRPVLKGHILYYPDTPLTRRIMKQVRNKVDIAKQLGDFIETIVEIANRTEYNYRDNFRMLKDYEPILELLEAADDTDLTDIADLWPPPARSGYYNRRPNSTKDAFLRFVDIMKRVDLENFFNNDLPNYRRKIACFIVPNRVQAVKDANALVRRGMDYVEEDALWAAIQFYDLESDGNSSNSTVPHLIKYSIRMDPDIIDRTTAFKDRPSRISIRRDPFRDLKYFTSGFIYLQDAIDKAIISIHAQELRGKGNRTINMNPVQRNPSPLLAKASTIGAIMQQFPYPCYVEDFFLQTLGSQLTMYIVLGWIYQAAMIVKSVVLEKERKLREVARIMGISPGLHFLSWNIFWFFLMMVTCLLFVIIVKGGGVLIYSSPGPIFLIMMAYSTATISFCFFVSSFFNRANIAAVVGGLFYFLTYIAYGAIASFADSYQLPKMMIASLLPNIALGFSWEIVGDWELKTDGATGANFGKPISNDPSDAYTLGHALLMLIIDTVLYYFLAWYIDQIFPGEYGVPRPWYFFFTPSFWCENSSAKQDLTMDEENLENIDMSRSPSVENSPQPLASPGHNHNSAGNGHVNSSRIEGEPKHLHVGCVIRNLVKVYKPGAFTRCSGSIKGLLKKAWQRIKRCFKGNHYSPDDSEHAKELRPAVDHLSLNLYEGHITALLGHNGAGKTTTMSIMTGLIPASSGTVIIKGLDVAKDIDKVRRMTGFCPQFNVLYDDLTVGEHLWFYGRMRDIDSALLAEEVDTLLKDTNLTKKKHEQARHLSGGMRRRLSIAVAFIGNSKCVILDEPTAGVDPFARRQIWDLIAKFRTGRTIILSTHHMDEAEILSDRIAVMSQGRLQTCGSPLFLKQTFGDGYGLVVVRDVPAFLKKSVNKLMNGTSASVADTDDSGVCNTTIGSERDEYSSELEDSVRFHTSASSVLSDSDRRHEDLISSFVGRYFNAYQVVEHVGHEIHYRIDYKGVPKFSEFFKALDESLGELCINNYGLSDTSLEEIFIKIADEADVCEEQVETLTEAGNLPRPVTRLSFRGRLRKTALRVLHGGKRSRSLETLSASTENIDYSNVASEVSSISGNCPPSALTLPTYTPITGYQLVLLQFYALLMKRMHRTRRNWKGFITEIILPAVFVFLGVVLIKIGGYTPVNPPPLELHPWVLTPGSAISQDTRLYTFFGAVNTTDPLTRDLQKAFARSEYAGTRCMSPAANYTIDGYACKVNTTINGVNVPANESDWQHLDRYRERTCQCQESGLQDCVDSSSIMLASSFNTSSSKLNASYVYMPFDPAYRRLKTTDDVLNLTGADVSQYIIDQFTRLRHNFYGGFTFLVPEYGLNQSEADEYRILLNDLAYITSDSFNRSFANNTRNFATVKWRNMTPIINNLANRTQTFVNRTQLPELVQNITSQLNETIQRSRGKRQAPNGLITTSRPSPTPTTLKPPSSFRNNTWRVNNTNLPVSSQNNTLQFGNNTFQANMSAWNYAINRTIARNNGSRLPQAWNRTQEWVRNVRTLRNQTRVPILSNLSVSMNVSELVDFLSTGLFAPASLLVWYNNKGWPSSVAYNNYANNLLLRLTMSADVNNPDSSYGIVAINHPLNYTHEEFGTQLQRAVFVDVLMAIMLILAMSFVPASFVIFLIEDRRSDSKHVQMVSGLQPYMYWLANYVWDCLNYVIPCLICLLIFSIFNVEAYMNNKSAGALFLLLVLYGFAVTPMLYPASIFLGTPSTAFVLLACANLFIGSATTIATYMLDMLETQDESLIPINNVLKVLFFIFPQYCLGRGLLNMAISYRTAQSVAYLLGTGIVNHEPMKWRVCGQFFFVLILHAVGWFFVNLLIEYGPVITARIAKRLSCCRRDSKGSRSGDKYTPANDPNISEDADVAKERQTIMNEDLNKFLASSLTLVVKDLSKIFKTSRGKLTAVDQLTFGVPVGQCFGLLGVNGAGKTTTFRMLTGHVKPSGGTAAIHGFDIATSRTEANRLIGYCPQADCITPLLTGRENLQFFARLRGVPESLVKHVAEFNIRRMDLRRHADKPARHYSGGNKRKLSVAISLTGEPPLVFLDEPTAGIDPRARRFLWRAISQLLIQGQSVILTTHSMDECEALCTRLAIMVNGRFRCMGSPQHLKAKYGEGYFVSVRFAPGTVDAHRVSTTADALRARFPDTLLKEWHDTVALFSLGASGSYRLNLGQVFAFFQDPSFVAQMHIVDFSVTQSSLDAVFVAFAKSQSTELADSDRDPGVAVSSSGNGRGYENRMHPSNEVTVRSFANGTTINTGFENPVFEEHA